MSTMFSFHTSALMTRLCVSYSLGGFIEMKSYGRGHCFWKRDRNLVKILNQKIGSLTDFKNSNKKRGFITFIFNILTCSIPCISFMIYMHSNDKWVKTFLIFSKNYFLFFLVCATRMIYGKFFFMKTFCNIIAWLNGFYLFK